MRNNISHSQTINDARKVFPFFDLDVTATGTGFLKTVHSDGFTLLPLNTAAMGLCKANGLPFTLLDQWIGTEGISKARQDASIWEHNWYAPARGAFSSDGLCWPEFDNSAMYWFWRDIVLADIAAKAMLQRGVRELKCIVKMFLRPALYYYRSDIHTLYWKSFFVDRVRLHEAPQKSDDASEYNRFLTPGIRFKGYKDNPVLISSAVLKDKVVLALNFAEFHRFTPVIRQLSTSFSGKLAAVILNPAPELARRLTEEHALPVVSPIKHDRVDSRLKDQFSRGYNFLLNQVDGKPWVTPLKFLDFHFRYYCRRRWPALSTSFRSWVELFQRTRPRAIIVSSLEDAESQLPAAAGKAVGIPTVSIPHGLVSWEPEVVTAEHVLYCNAIQRKVLERGKAASQCLIGCRNLIADNEYPCTPSIIKPIQSSWRVLAITNPVGMPECMMPEIVASRQIEAFRALDNPPVDLANKIELKIKVHPGFPDKELFQIVSRRLAAQVLPTDSDLKTVLDQTDLVLAVNYCSGSALIHVLNSFKPVIFFRTDCLMTEKDRQHNELCIPGGIEVKLEQDLWNSIRTFFKDPRFAQKMQSKARAFARKYLDDSHNPHIGDVIHQVLSGKAPFQDRQRNLNSEHPEEVQDVFLGIKQLQVAGEFETAARAVDQTLKKNPTHLDLQNLKAELKIQTGDSAAGQSILLNIIKRSPSHVAALNNLAVIEVEKKNWQAAKEFLKDALNVDPENSIAISNLSYVKQRMTFFEQGS
jgi:hypothetical protein